MVDRARALDRGVGYIDGRGEECTIGLGSCLDCDAGGWLETCWKARCGSYFCLVVGGVAGFSLGFVVSPSSDLMSLMDDGICGGGSSASSRREFLVTGASAPVELLFHAAFNVGSSGKSSVTVRLSGDLPHVLVVCGGVPTGEIVLDCRMGSANYPYKT